MDDAHNSTVPSGLELLAVWFPALKRRAIFTLSLRDNHLPQGLELPNGIRVESFLAAGAPLLRENA